LLSNIYSIFFSSSVIETTGIIQVRECSLPPNSWDFSNINSVQFSDWSHRSLIVIIVKAFKFLNLSAWMFLYNGHYEWNLFSYQYLSQSYILVTNYYWNLNLFETKILNSINLSSNWKFIIKEKTTINNNRLLINRWQNID
jgi:hypothetical protein